MQAAKPGKACNFQSWYQAKHICLGTIFQLGLKAHHIEQRAERIILPKLNNRIGLTSGLCALSGRAVSWAVAQRFSSRAAITSIGKHH